MFHADRSSRTMSEQVAALWQHECARVFQDRIADSPTRDWFNKTLHQVSGSIDLVEWVPERIYGSEALVYVCACFRTASLLGPAPRTGCRPHTLPADVAA